MIFRKIQTAIISLRTELALIEDGEKIQLIQHKLEALNEIRRYIISYEWMSHTKAKEKLQFFLNHKLDYTLTAQRFNVSKNSVEMSVSLLARKLEKKIGISTLSLIENGEVQAALFQFRVGIGSIKTHELFPEGVFKIIPTSNVNTHIDLINCKYELNQLKLLSTRSIEEKITSLNVDKIGFLFYILQSSDIVYSIQKKLIYKYFSGEIETVEELLELLEGKSVYE